MSFVVGQRIINESDPQLGLGIVIDIPDDRLIEVYFPMKEERCIYRLNTAPLRRIVLGVGQVATNRAGEHLRIERIEEEEGIVTYWGDGRSMHEGDLEDKVPLASSLGRMRYGNIGQVGDMDLRLEAHNLRAKMLSSRAYFLGASRVTLLPHQLYVTNKVCSMFAPRVLLSDEVGLGKTIEAGMIFSYLKASGRASRVLIVLPDSLTHQWLAEMARRFNEIFRVVGSEALEEEDNPYFDSRRAITPWTALKGGLLKKAYEYDWDLLIVDEAHHLREGQKAYEAIRGLAERSKSVLLLTATPSRGGERTEFGLLRLVDPERFVDYESYVKERENWKHTADLAHRLQAGEEALEEAKELYKDDESIAKIEDNQSLLEAMIDRHGPGRIFFRNRRSRLQELFCGRNLHAVPLSRNGAENDFPGLKELNEQQKGQDPRILWIVSYMATHPGEKVVLIAHSMKLVAALSERLRELFGIYSAVFHEGLTVFERDKQAVWFSDPQGADLLLCSEIGSEGRNFQKAHTLIFWDIPMHPDTIEQRIGRLDRIGQFQPVDLYVMYFKGGKEERLFYWHKMLGSFNGPVVGGEEIFDKIKLEESLNVSEFTKIIRQSCIWAKEYRENAEASVDCLVDMNSFNEKVGTQLKELVEKEIDPLYLEKTVVRLLERFGVDVEEQDVPHLYHFAPSKNMQMESLSRMYEDGMLATFDRQLALEREEVEYINGSHPIVKEILSYMVDGTEGSASVVIWKKAPQRGTLLQYLFILEATGSDRLELGRYLAPTPLKINCLLNGTLYKGELPANRSLDKLKSKDVTELWGMIGSRVESTTEKASNFVQTITQSLRDKARLKAEKLLKDEIDRLSELSKYNDSIKKEDIENQIKLRDEVCKAITEANARLDSIRIVYMLNEQ
ncbi:RNA polymerase-associated protein RapA [bacterium]|nr:RNA polymerase-associated protein RapA [bacterium]